jgi:hypothetical protein
VVKVICVFMKIFSPKKWRCWFLFIKKINHNIVFQEKRQFLCLSDGDAVGA